MKLKNEIIDKSPCFLPYLEAEGEKNIFLDQSKPEIKVASHNNNSSTEKLFAQMRGKVQYFEELTTPSTEEWENL